MKKKTKENWKVTITFVPFESSEERDEAYRKWIRLFLEGKKAEMKTRKSIEAESKKVSS